MKTMYAKKQRKKTHGKVLVNLIIMTAGVLLITAVLNPNTGNSVKFLKGYVNDSDIDSKRMYDETALTSFESEADWYPARKNGTPSQPETAARAGMLVDINSGDLLYEKNSKEKLKIASLTKIMTAVVVLEHKNINDKIYITSKSAGVGENTMVLSKGEVYTVKELLYGLILHSGNDAAYALAEGTAGSSERFIEWMNFKARELGLRNTFFTDPSGLNDNTYSTPEDLIKLTRYALKNSVFKEIIKTVEYEIYGTKEHKYIYLSNQTNLLTTYPGVAGVKTGYTEEAGLCLITYAENNGREVVGIILNSIDRKGDMVLMLDHGFKTLGINIQHNLF